MKEKDLDRAETNSSLNKKKKQKRKKNNLFSIFLLFLILVGFGIIVYPTFSDWWNSYHATQAIASYSAKVDNMDYSEKRALLDAAYAYNESLPLGVNFKVEDEAYAEYEKILDVSGTGIMGYVTIPKINVYLPIYHGTSESVLQIAVGHVAGSSLPVGGEGTHSVLSGHRGLPSAKLFTDLDKMEIGDTFTITILSEVLTYQIDAINVVLPEDVSNLAIEDGKDYVTLVTCTPYGVNSHRMLVRGHRVETPEEVVKLDVKAEATTIPVFKVVAILMIPALVIVMIIVLIFGGGKPKKSNRAILDELHEKQ